MIDARRMFGAAVLMGCWTAFSSPAFAAASDAAPAAAPASQAAPADQSDGLQEVIVTAQRREEHLQNVPIAVNVVGAQQLLRTGVLDTKSIAALVPGLDFQSISGSASVVYLRGVGSNDGNPNAEPSVATYIDGVYIANNSANILDLNNIERVEVLKGPQGTLFGRNATGGVIQVITRDPKHDPSVDASIGYGNYNTLDGSIYGTTGLTENAAIDLALQFSHQGNGYGTNILNGDDIYYSRNFSARSKLLLTPGDTTEIRIAGDYSQRHTDGASYRLALSPDGVAAPADPYDARSDPDINGHHNGVGNTESYGASVNAQHVFGDVTGKSITSYRHQQGLYVLDEDTTPDVLVSAYLPEHQWNVSQELQAFFNTGGIDFTFGGFLYESNAFYDNAELTGLYIGGTSIIDSRQRTRSGSAYGQFTAPITDTTKITGGLRYTAEQTKFTASANGIDFPDGKRRFNKFTWRLALDHEFTDQVHGYLSYNRGIKGGGFDMLTPGSQGFAPESLDAYEVGLKSKLLHNHLRLNASAFIYHYQDIQVQVIPAGAVQTNNAGAAHIKGVDLDFEALPFRNFTLSGGFAVLSGHYTKYPDAIAYPATLFQPSFVFDAAGEDTVRTPKFTANLSASYDIPTEIGKFNATVTGSHNSGYFYDSANLLKQPSYTLLNVTIGWRAPGDRFGLALWGRNLTKEYYFTQGVPSGVGFLTVPAAPRTYGVRASVKF